jgi:hypothetical protein
VWKITKREILNISSRRLRRRILAYLTGRKYNLEVEKYPRLMMTMLRIGLAKGHQKMRLHTTLCEPFAKDQLKMYPLNHPTTLILKEMVVMTMSHIWLARGQRKMYPLTHLKPKLGGPFAKNQQKMCPLTHLGMKLGGAVIMIISLFKLTWGMKLGGAVIMNISLFKLARDQ